MLFKPDNATKWQLDDPQQANPTLLDESRNFTTAATLPGFRLLPDGRQATIIVEHASQEWKMPTRCR